MKVNFRNNKFINPWQFVKINIIYVPRDHVTAVANYTNKCEP